MPRDIVMAQSGLTGGWCESCMMYGLAVARLDNSRRMITNSIVSALVALSVLTGVATTANAFDAKKFWDEHPSGSQR